MTQSDGTSTPLRVYLFGHFRIEREGETVRLPTRKARLILAYLVLRPEPHTREKLAALFWPDVPDDAARTSLRIPIWVGGGWPLRGPARRAARWDGSCLYRHEEHHMTPGDVGDLKAFVREHRGSVEDYDICVGGSPRGPDWGKERATIRALAEAGVTWWTEYIPPDAGGLDRVRARIRRGPLRIDG